MLICMADFDLASHIQRMRKDLGWSQEELARRSRVDQGDISRIEAGITDPRWSTVRRISEALGLAIEVKKPTTTSGRLSSDSRKRVRTQARNTALRRDALGRPPLQVKR